MKVLKAATNSAINSLLLVDDAVATVQTVIKSGRDVAETVRFQTKLMVIESAKDYDSFISENPELLEYAPKY